MSKIFISGLVNIESSLEIDDFPIEYSPIEFKFFGINSSVSGVGYNVAKAFKTLGNDVDLFSIIGEDNNSEIIKNQLKKDGIDSSNLIVYKENKAAETIVIYNKEGKRKIYCDLKNLQELDPYVDGKIIISNPKIYDLAVITNINFNKSLLNFFKEHNVPVATDVHVLTNVYDDYNQKYMRSADILFLSNEGCKDREAEFLREIYNISHNKIIVIGCGHEGALAYQGEYDKFFYEPAVAPYGVKNTVGSGDALFTSFIHYYIKTKDIQKSLKFAVTFAGIKISASGGAKGFVSEKEVEENI